MAAATAGQAQIVANFTDGTGTTSSDQYLGRSGDGWSAGWVASSATGTVITTTPLNDGGNYLAVAPGTGSLSGSVRRQYTSTSSVDIADTYRISWDWRFTGSMSAMNSYDDRIQFFGDTSGSVGSSSTTNTWLIGWVAADNGTTNDVHEGNWYFFDNNGSNAFTKANMFNTGVGLTAGAVYSFIVDVNPDAGTYSATIVSGSTTVTGTDLTFRRGAVNVSGTASPVLGFGVNRSLTSDDVKFALDSLSISTIPEPSAFGVLAGLGALLAATRRRGGRARR